MRRSLLLVLVLVALAACGPGRSRTQADMDRDGRSIAGAIHAADLKGTGFSLQQTFILTGGDIPGGREIRLQASANDGVMKDGSARFTYRTQQGDQQTNYDVIAHDQRLYVKRRDGAGWKTTPISSTTSLFPALRLELVREVVLLARSISPATLSRVDAGIARKYVVRPAADQLEQLHAISEQGPAQQEFLRTATAEVAVFLLIPGNELGRVEVRLSGVDPTDGTKQRIENGLDLRSARVGAIRPPESAQQVDPSELLT